MRKRISTRTTLVMGLTLIGGLLLGCQSTKPVDQPPVEPKTKAVPYSVTKYSSATSKSNSSPASWAALNCHDPDLFQDTDGTYYVFSTDASIGGAWKGGVQIRKSTDLVNWTCLPEPAIRTWDPDMLSWCGLDASNATTWAPCVIKVGGKYLMYHGIIISNEATNNEPRAWIGLAIADKVTGPYIPAAQYDRKTYHSGTVVRYSWDSSSDRGAKCLNVADGSWNQGFGAIDPSVVADDAGNLWLNYGSWKGGIAILPLDNKTGMPKDGYPADTIPNGFGTKIAGGAGAAYEGATVVNFADSKYYYLFMSCGQVDSDYSVRVGRRLKTDGIAGPYFDSNGFDLTAVDAGGDSDNNFHLHGNKILGSSAFKGEFGWRAPGGPSVLLDASGRRFLAVHARTNFMPTYYFYLQVYQLYLNADGWPVINPNEYAGETLGGVEASALHGSFEAIHSARGSNYGSFKNFEGNEAPWVEATDANETVSKTVVFQADGTLTGAWTGTWKLEGTQLTLDLKTQAGEALGIYQGVVTKATDWARKGTKANRATVAFTTFCPKTGEYFYGDAHNE